MTTPEYTAPTIGRIVRYKPSAVLDELAAIVTRLEDDGSVDLAVFGYGDMMFVFGVPHSFDNEPNTWHWPSR